MLTQRIELSETPPELSKHVAPLPPHKSLWRRFRELFHRSTAQTVPPAFDEIVVRIARSWATDKLRVGDELWLYSTGVESWEHLCGEMGYAIVRGGKVVEFSTFMEN